MHGRDWNLCPPVSIEHCSRSNGPSQSTSSRRSFGKFLVYTCIYTPKLHPRTCINPDRTPLLYNGLPAYSIPMRTDESVAGVFFFTLAKTNHNKLIILLCQCLASLLRIKMGNSFDWELKLNDTYKDCSVKADEFKDFRESDSDVKRIIWCSRLSIWRLTVS